MPRLYRFRLSTTGNNLKKFISIFFDKEYLLLVASISFIINVTNSSYLLLVETMKKPTELIALKHLVCLEIRGNDARSFLQSQLTIDALKLTPGQSRVGAYCEPKGRVISTFILALIDDVFLMILPAVLIDTVMQTLLRYRMRAMLDIEYQQNSFLFGCSQQLETLDSLPRFAHPLDPSRSFIYAQSEQFENIHEPIDAYWEIADINCGMVWLNELTTTQHLPQSLGLLANNAVDFDKGCYPGQEIIARLNYLGQPKYALYRFEAEIDPAQIKQINLIRNTTGKRKGQCLNCTYQNNILTGLAAISVSSLTSSEDLFIVDENSVPLGNKINITGLSLPAHSDS